MSTARTLFEVEEYVRCDDGDEEWRVYWPSRWPCSVCKGTPLPAPGFENDRYPIGADPCLGWLEDVQYACCGHGDPRRAYVVGAMGHLRGDAALSYFAGVKAAPRAKHGDAFELLERRVFECVKRGDITSEDAILLMISPPDRVLEVVEAKLEAEAVAA